MEYQITLISHLAPQNAKAALQRIYELPEPPAGSYAMMSVGSTSIITLYREAAEDGSVLEAYGEKLNKNTAIRQMQREMHSAVGQMDPDMHDVAIAITLAKALCDDLKNGDCDVQGLEEAPTVHRIRTARPVIGEDGARYYAAIGTKGSLDVVRADDLNQAWARLQEDGGLDSPPAVDFHLLGHESPFEIR
jgi:hypothetical protein